MTGTARLHFIYIVSMLVAAIVGLATAKLADNEQVVSYVSFALTLASILLAIVATVYAFVSNASLAQSIGGLHQAASEVRLGAASINALAMGLESKVGAFTEKVEATHNLVRSLSNPSAANAADIPAHAVGDAPSIPDQVLESMVSRSSNSGIIAMYAATIAFKTGRSFNRQKLFETLGEGNEAYYWGWLLALDAAGVLQIRDGSDGTWTVSHVPDLLLDQVAKAALDAPDVRSSDVQATWNKRKVSEIDAYFQA